MVLDFVTRRIDAPNVNTGYLLLLSLIVLLVMGAAVGIAGVVLLLTFIIHGVTALQSVLGASVMFASGSAVALSIYNWFVYV